MPNKCADHHHLPTLPSALDFAVSTGRIQIEGVADPGFSKTGDNSKGGRGANFLISQFFSENCMKMKEIHWRIQGGARGRAHLPRVKFFHFRVVFDKTFAK